MSLARPPQKEKASAGSLVARFVGFLLFLGLTGAIVWAYSVTSGIDSFEIVDPEESPPGTLVTLSNGQSLHYREMGSGPPVLLVHDYDVAGGYQWLAVAEALPNYRLIIPDQIDFGFGTHPNEMGRQHTVSGRAETLSLLIEELGLGSTTLVGAGMGGTVAAQLAADGPEMVERLVLIAPEIYGPTPTWTETFFRLPLVGPALIFTNLGGGNRAVENYQAECITGGWCPTAADLEVREGAARVQGTTAALLAMASTPRATTIPADLGQITAPTLVIWGDNDRVTPLSDGRQLVDAISGSSLDVLAGVGHRPHRQDPAATAGLIETFLGSSGT